MRIIHIACVLLWIDTSNIYAQSSTYQPWYEGIVVLESEDSLQGVIKYDFSKNVVQLQQSNRSAIYAARNVKMFQIKDDQSRQIRTFYSLPYALVGNYKTTVFFELIVEGKLTLLCREHIERRQDSFSPYFRPRYIDILVTVYFLFKEDGSIRSLHGYTRRRWLDMMNDKRKPVQNFVKENRLTFSQKEDLQKIVQYYNQLHYR